MLRRLRIENLVLIHEADLTFATGLNAVTGETGAGKTIFAQAIGLLLGARADASSVGSDGSEAYVEAELDVPDGFFDEEEVAALAELRPEDEAGLVIARRVFGDGRYELYSTDRPGDAPEWKAYDPFTVEQVAELAAEADRLAAALPDRIAGSDPPNPDQPTAVFTLKGRRVEVAQWPEAAPELEALLDRVAELRKAPPVASPWRLWSRGEVVELEAGCDIGEVPALSRLRDALFMPGARGEAPGGENPPEGTPLVAITFRAPGGDEQLDVYADGRRVDRARGSESSQELSARQLGAIRAAVAETDWAALPRRLC